MHGRRQSDRLVVPAKRTNKTEQSVAEVVEGRRRRKGNVTSKPHLGHSAEHGATNELAHVRRIRLWPDVAFDPSEEPSAVVLHAGICTGGCPKGQSLPCPHRRIGRPQIPAETRDLIL